MRVIQSATDMIAFSTSCRSEGKSIGFVPTMGALHAGHSSLVDNALENNDIVVVSVFVNPTQFNDAADLEKYPRTFEQDKELLEKLDVDVMFFPSVEEIYPSSDNPSYVLDGLDNLMEGPNRPGHFEGVVQVVTRLFDLCLPHRAYFGEKDFQQLAIIRHMTRKLKYEVDVIGCPTVREDDGLAMSSRNVRLEAYARQVAPALYQVLSSLRSTIEDDGVEKALSFAKTQLDVEEIELEYLELVDSVTLQQANDQTGAIQACIAAWIGGVRLIDNLRVK